MTPKGTFDTYVRQHSVLFTRGEAGRTKLREARNGARAWRPWLPLRPTSRPARRVCPQCAADPGLLAQLGLLRHHVLTRDALFVLIFDAVQRCVEGDGN